MAQNLTTDQLIYSKVVALTGGIGSGKSTAAGFLEENGAVTISADELARKVTAPGSPGLLQLEKRFGREILDSHGSLDRKKLGSIVFSDPAARQDLEAITHPLIRTASVEDFTSEASKSPPLIVYDVPLLFEAGLDRLGFKAIVVVTAPPEQIQQRLTARGLSLTDINNRIASQMPLGEKAKRADYVLENSGSLADLKRQCLDLFGKLKR